MIRKPLVYLVLLICLSSAACAADRDARSDGDHSPSTTEPPGEAVAQINEDNNAPIDEWVARMIVAAADYQTWGKVDERPAESPFLCRMPSPGLAARVHLSEAGDAAKHGRKLYYLFATDKRIYLSLGFDRDLAEVIADPVLGAPDYRGYAPAELPQGFTVVKEAHEALPGASSDPWEQGALNAPPPTSLGDEGVIPEGYVPPSHTQLNVNGETFHVGDPRGLFVLTKVGPPDTPDTDAGWIYGTVSPDGEVTAAGLIDNCMGCHAAAEHERLFGYWERYRD